MAIPAPIKKLAPEVKRWRRDLHQHPEVGYDLPRTSKFVADKLKEFGLEKVETGLGQSGVVGMLRGTQGRQNTTGGSIMIRADMDALPMHEESGVKHASKTPGKFHGCGHDGHTACLLGAAKHLATTRNFKGTVYFCFQPAEEGGAGAKAMMDDGLFEKYPADAVYGAHNWPSMPVGFMGCSEGKMLAASQEFYITLTGKGGHAARPHEAHDPVVAGAELVLSLQSIISRNTDPIETAVLSVTQFQAGTTTNVIPNSAKLAGTMRSFSNVTMKKMIAEIRRKAKAVGAAHQVTVEVALDDKPYPALINSKREARFAAGVMKDLLGEGNCVINPPPAMGSEDFAYYLIKDARTGRKTPGCFVTFGNGLKGPMLHNPRYDFNDEAIPHMIAFWSKLAERALPAA